MDKNDLIDRTALLRKWDEKFFAMGGDRLGPNGDEIMWYLNSLIAEIKNAPTVKTYCYFCGQTEHGVEERPQDEWYITPDRQITIEEYMQSLKGEN